MFIPEGVDAVYSSTTESEHGHEKRDEHGHAHGSQVTAIALALLLGFITMSASVLLDESAELAGS